MKPFLVRKAKARKIWGPHWKGCHWLGRIDKHNKIYVTL